MVVLKALQFLGAARALGPRASDRVSERASEGGREGGKESTKYRRRKKDFCALLRASKQNNLFETSVVVCFALSTFRLFLFFFFLCVCVCVWESS